MATLVLGHMFAYPLHIASWADFGRKRGGSIDYRVTNPFDGPDFLNGGKHRATDVGNTRMNDSLRSPAVCRVTGRRHTDGALGVEFDLGGGVILGLWHLNRVDPPLNRWTPVARGQIVGLTGNTGGRISDGKGGTMPMPAHTHVEIKRNGVPFDVEPYLPMVERAARPIQLKESTVEVPQDVGYLATGVVGPDNRLRVHHSTTDGSQITDRPTAVQIFGIKRGGTPYTVGGQAGSDWYFVGALGRSWYVAKPLVTQITATGYLPSIVPLPSADCSPQEATILQLSNKIARARTANRGASQAQQVVEEALA